jgi:hypothetical protein
VASATCRRPISTRSRSTAARAQHRGLFLGANVDAEADGLPSALADGDDLNGTDDENGVAAQGVPTVAGGGFVTVTVTGSRAS